MLLFLKCEKVGCHFLYHLPEKIGSIPYTKIFYEKKVYIDKKMTNLMAIILCYLEK